MGQELTVPEGTLSAVAPVGGRQGVQKRGRITSLSQPPWKLGWPLRVVLSRPELALWPHCHPLPRADR